MSVRRASSRFASRFAGSSFNAFWRSTTAPSTRPNLAPATPLRYSALTFSGWTSKAALDDASAFSHCSSFSSAMAEFKCSDTRTSRSSTCAGVVADALSASSSESACASRYAFRATRPSAYAATAASLSPDLNAAFPRSLWPSASETAASNAASSSPPASGSSAARGEPEGVASSAAASSVGCGASSPALMSQRGLESCELLSGLSI
mmetsp:Transcript_14019/g.43454  ORF Transcript_14019/g.43454 Transcript_14019/m.43454 type:complete len:207 (-) Transcript_14019:109-729(-)